MAVKSGTAAAIGIIRVKLITADDAAVVFIDHQPK